MRFRTEPISFLLGLLTSSLASIQNNIARGFAWYADNQIAPGNFQNAAQHQYQEPLYPGLVSDDAHLYSSAPFYDKELDIYQSILKDISVEDTPESQVFGAPPAVVVAQPDPEWGLDSFPSPPKALGRSDKEPAWNQPGSDDLPPDYYNAYIPFTFDPIAIEPGYMEDSSTRSSGGGVFSFTDQLDVDNSPSINFFGYNPTALVPKPVEPYQSEDSRINGDNLQFTNKYGSDYPSPLYGGGSISGPLVAGSFQPYPVEARIDPTGGLLFPNPSENSDSPPGYCRECDILAASNPEFSEPPQWEGYDNPGNIPPSSAQPFIFNYPLPEFCPQCIPPTPQPPAPVNPGRGIVNRGRGHLRRYPNPKATNVGPASGIPGEAGDPNHGGINRGRGHLRRYPNPKATNVGPASGISGEAGDPNHGRINRGQGQLRHHPIPAVVTTLGLTDSTPGETGVDSPVADPTPSPPPPPPRRAAHPRKKAARLSPPYKCPFCERQFIRKYDMERHIRIHTGEKPFICKTCLETFIRKDTLKTHRWRSGCNRRQPAACELVDTMSPSSSRPDINQ